MPAYDSWKTRSPDDDLSGLKEPSREQQKADWEDEMQQRSTEAVMKEAPTAAEFSALADKFQAGFDQCMGSGYQEYGEDFIRTRQMVIMALRAASSLRALAELPPLSPDLTIGKRI